MKPQTGRERANSKKIVAMCNMTPEEFKQIRLESGYSQLRLARLLKISQGTISNYEQGLKDIEPAMSRKMQNYKVW